MLAREVELEKSLPTAGSMKVGHEKGLLVPQGPPVLLAEAPRPLAL
jgi:hypothetical protein